MGFGDLYRVEVGLGAGISFIAFVFAFRNTPLAETAESLEPSSLVLA